MGIAIFSTAGRAATAEGAAPATSRAAQVASTPAGTGFTVVGTTLSADVYLDGDKIGTTPLPGVVACAAGEHTIRVTRLGYAPYIDVFKVKDGKVARIEVELVPVAGVLRLKASVDQARVFLDDRFVGDAPVELEMKVGQHKVKVSRFGHRDEVFAVNAVAGEIVERTVRMEELPPELNPYRQAPPPPPKWYERWWVWTAGAGGVAVLAVAVIVPAVLATRSECDKAGAEICTRVPAPVPAGLVIRLP
jgi:hypothetical protein